MAKPKRRHLRTSKKGKKFYAGKGFWKIPEIKHAEKKKKRRHEEDEEYEGYPSDIEPQIPSGAV